ncbi:MAG: hypothetical protein ABSE82_15815, partial [Nitrososphaerales archaeon]
FNVFGYQNGSQANFNSGISLSVKTNNYEQGESCSSTSYTLETNNLSLGTCSHGTMQQYISFSES